MEIMRPCHRFFLPALSFSLRLDCFLSVDVDVGQLLILFDLELPGQIREYRVGNQGGLLVCQEVEERCKQI